MAEAKLGRAAAVDEVRSLKRKLSKCATAIAVDREREKNKKLRSQKKNEHEKWRYQKQQAESAKSRLLAEGDSLQYEAEIIKLTDELADVEGENRDCRVSIEQKEEEIEALKIRVAEAEAEEVVTFQGREYRPDFVEYLWKLQASNVPFDKISNVIRDSGVYFKRKPTKLPTDKTVSEMNTSRLAASQIQVEVERERE